MSGSCRLAGAVINLAAMREYCRKDLLTHIDNVRGPKIMVLDPSLSGPLALIVEIAQLKEHEIENIFYLGKENPTKDYQKVIYVCRPQVRYMRLMAGHILENENSQSKKEYTLLFVPRATTLCEKVLEEEGVRGNVQVGEFKLDFIPFDEDVISLEYGWGIRECFLEKNYSTLFYVAKALLRLQSMFGIIPNVKCFGNVSKRALDVMSMLHEELRLSESQTIPEIDTLVLFDRNLDYVTPLLTQLTYEGLIDEFFGIKNSYVDLEASISGQKDGKKMKMPLNSNDSVFVDIRDLHIGNLGKVLSGKVKTIDEHYKQRHNASVVEMKDFVKKLTSFQTLNTHTNIASAINERIASHDFRKRVESEQSMLYHSDAQSDVIDECISKQMPAANSLRLMCLQSLTCNGFKRNLDKIKRNFLHAYGFEHSITLRNLEQAHLLFKTESTAWSWPSLRKTLPLVSDEETKDIHYLYSGYAPLSIRLIQAGLRQKPVTGVAMKHANGAYYEARQKVPQGVLESLPSQRRKVILVFFVGGVTFAEISALRYMSNMQENVDYIAASTSVISGNTLVKSFMPTVVTDKEAF